MTARTVGGMLILLQASITGASSAQQDTTRLDPEQVSVAGGMYDKPYLTTLAGRTALGGYAEGHARFARADGVTEELGFEAKRFNLFTATRVSDYVRIGAEIEFEEGGEEIKLEYAAIDVMFSARLGLRAGMILSPLGRFNLSHDSPRNEFTDRPLVSTELTGVALSEPGVGVFGALPFGGSSRVTYEAYATNGFHDGLINASPDGTRIPLGRGNAEDQNASPALVARTAYSPGIGYELGVSVHHGAYNVFDAEGLAVDERRDLTIWVMDVEAAPLGVRLSGEWALASIDVTPGLRDVYATRQRGFYWQAVRDFGDGWVRNMPRSYFSVAARLDRVDFDADAVGDDISQVSLGVNFRPTNETVLKLDYLRGWSDDAFNNRAHHAGVLFSVATYF